MPSSVFFGMQHLNNNLLCAIKVNPICRGGEPIEVCVLPLNQMLEVHPEIPLFNMRMKPCYKDNIDWEYIEMSRAKVAQILLEGYESEKVADLLLDWFLSINLPERKRIIPLAHGWPEQKQVLLEWLGPQNFAQIFSDDYRDTLIATHFINDKHAVTHEPVPFAKQDIMWISKKLHCERMNSKSGDPTNDAYLVAQSYKRLLQV